MSWYDFRLLIAIMALIFVFDGEPDVWDHLHELAMTAGCKA